MFRLPLIAFLLIACMVPLAVPQQADAHEPFPLATAFFRARANVAALRVARLQQPIIVQKVVKQQIVQQVVAQPVYAYAAPVVQFQAVQAYSVPVVQQVQVQQYVAPVQQYVAPVQVQAVHGCAAFFSY